MLFADKIITLKPFDANGDYTDGRGDSYRKSYDGSYELLDIPAGTYSVLIAAADDNCLTDKINNVTVTDHLYPTATAVI